MELLEQFTNKHILNEWQSHPDKYINGLESLITLNEKAVKADYNRSLYINRLIDEICSTKNKNPFDKSAKELWDIKFPIIFSMIHNDTEVRVIFSWGNGNAQLDMSFDDYAALPKIADIK